MREKVQSVIDEIRPYLQADGGDIELVDIETNEGFEKFRKEVLDFSDGAVPSAYKDGEKCLIRIDKESNNLLLECPTTTAPPSSGQD